MGKKLQKFSQAFWKNARPKAVQAKLWIRNNPKKATAIAGSVIAPPVAAIAVFPVIALGGFTGAGVAAGSIAAVAQSAIGNVAAGSVFAFLQSAGAGGAGASILGLSVWGGTSVACWGATVASFIKDKHGESADSAKNKTDGNQGEDGEPKS